MYDPSMATPRTGPSEAELDTLAMASTIAEPPRARAQNAYTVEPGTLLCGKYRVVRTLGRGGMGVVVEAFHLELQVPVAIKVLLPDFMAYAEAATRFQREARAVTRLTSQHVARVIDVDTLPSGEPFIVMEHLKGQDLAARGREPMPLSVGEAIDIFVQACDAIADAHANGIVHRDIKPANVFLATRSNGEPIVKVLDFGVSKVLSGSTSEVSLTQTTTILGSALYMSPEQMRSAKNVDARTDIYALGACLYEMLARRPPYVASSFPELCAMVYSGPPMSITEWSPDVSSGLAKVIEKSLAHEADARYASVAELVHAIAPFAEEETRARIEAILKQHAPHLAMPPPSKKRRTLEPVFSEDDGEARPSGGRRWVAWALVVLVMAGGGLAFQRRWPPALWSRGASGANEGIPAASGAPPSSAQAASEPAQAASGAKSATGDPATATSSDAMVPSAAASVEPAPSASASASTSATASASASAAATTSVAATTSASASKASASGSTAASGSAAASGAAAASTSAGSARPAVATSVSANGPRTSPPPRETTAAPGPTPPAPGDTSQGPPGPNQGLEDKTCYAILPDGSRQTVPCP